MKAPTLLVSLAALILSSCATRFPSAGETDATPAATARARDLLLASVAAHGTDPFRAGRTITAELEGEWSTLSPKVQPVLVDIGYRKTSTENYDLEARITKQTHRGPSGTKQVTRDHRQRTIAVSYNGTPANDPEVLSAAALVADAYLMFTTTPAYFLHTPNTGFSPLPDADLDGRSYHRLRTTLIPGLGDAASDDVVLWIDSETRRAHRVHFTLNGLESTRGAHVDVTYLGSSTAGNTRFPNNFIEVVRAPIRFKAHGWQTKKLEVR